MRSLISPPFLAIVGYFTFWWIYNINISPGLHGDEAWVGIKAIRALDLGLGTLSSMNSYTGKLQGLMSYLSFYFFGAGVSQLRLPGIFLNIANIISICYFIQNFKGRNERIYLLMIFAQSAFFITSPKIAWEVNSFTFLLISIQLIAIRNYLHEDSRKPLVWIGVFLFANIVGTYNHAIFMCLSISIIVTLVLWRAFQRIESDLRLIFLGILNLFNVSLVFLSMRFLIPLGYEFQSLLFLSVILFLELVWMESLLNVKLHIRFTVRKEYLGVLILPILMFFYFHGRPFFQLCSNIYILEHIYSYSSGAVERTIYICIGTIYCLLLIYFLAEDFFIKKDNFLCYFIISYVCVFNLFTLDSAYRYYLALFYITAVYMAIKIADFPTIKVFIGFLGFLGLGILNYSLITILICDYRCKRPIEIELSNGKIETSAHFVSTLPLVKELRKHKTINFYTIKDRYFVEQPVYFYYLIKPWQTSSSGVLKVDYDYDCSNTGFEIEYNNDLR